MTPGHTPHAHSQQQGFGLVEILVGMVIGLLAVAATVQSLHTLQLSQNEQARALQLDADARQLLNSIAQQMQMAGNQALRPSATGTVRIQGFTGDAITVGDAGELSVQYAVAADASHAGCLWYSSDTVGDISVNRYDVSAQSVRCSSNDNTQPLMDGVRQLQWQLAVASGAGLRWLSPAEVNALGLTGRIAAVRLCVHLEGGPSTAAPETVSSCDGSTLSGNGRLQVMRERTLWMSALKP